VDYKGDLDEFKRTFKEHLAIARHFGPYKLSIHSGSDKFSIYEIVAREAGELVHLKTADTSYLEALRVTASKDAGLFRQILDFAFTRWEEDRATYHVSANLSRVPRPEDLKDEDLAGMLEQFDGRQLLHCTFGSVLTWKNTDGSYKFRDRLLLSLRRNEEAYYDALATHLGKHIAPFSR
jgi:Tat protein secretion system quality control protein TatD with DNase activity